MCWRPLLVMNGKETFREGIRRSDLLLERPMRVASTPADSIFSCIVVDQSAVMLVSADEHPRKSLCPKQLHFHRTPDELNQATTNGNLTHALLGVRPSCITRMPEVASQILECIPVDTISPLHLDAPD
jgi:hypothetical protein